MAPVANWEASTSNSKGLLWSGCHRMGLVVARVMRRSRATVHSGVQTKGTPFLRRLRRGCAISVKPGMKARWYPRTPSVDRTSLMDFRIQGHLVMPAILLGSMRRVSPSSRRPRYSTHVCSKVHFCVLRKKDSCSRRSRTSCTIC